MRQVHRAGEKTFVDYSGKRPSLIEPGTGERLFVELFVGVLGASRLTFAEATLTQRVPDFLGSHSRMFEYFGGVTEIVVPDQLRSAVTIPSRTAPGIQRTYADLGRHYGTAIVPVEPRSALGKALSYIHKQWNRLTRFMHVPAMEMTNNDVERGLRTWVLDRKTWMFCGHTDSARRAADALTIITTCKNLGIDPRRYMRDTLRRILDGEKNFDALLPENYRPASSETTACNDARAQHAAAA
jgi:Transposase IS66 family/IS66 C-terminal element